MDVWTLLLFDLDLRPTTLTYNPRLAKVMPKIKVKSQTVQTRERPQPNGRTHTNTDATKRIIFPATGR